MKRSRSFPPWLALTICVPLTCMVVGLYSSWLYTTGVLRAARAAGVYASAEDGMLAIIDRGYINPDRVQIIYAGTNSFDGSVPHVWYVIACVWGGTRVDGTVPGSYKHDYDQPGLFFINTKDGWVHVGEGYFPEMLGFWMNAYGLAGPGSSTPSHDWGSTPSHGCEF